MTDERWLDLTARLTLPDAARDPLEAELDTYRRFAAAGTPQAPRATREELEGVAAAAGELLGAIEKLGPEALRALRASHPITVALPDDMEVSEPVPAGLAPVVGRPGATPSLDALKL
jgi:hypothetical protein